MKHVQASLACSRFLMILVLSIVFCALNAVAAEKSDLPPPDCKYHGRGEVFIFDSKDKKYEKSDKDSFDLSALRYALGNGKYLFSETKSFKDGRPQEKTMFALKMHAGPFSFDAPDGSLRGEGFCTRPGHCAGEMMAGDFIGRFATDFSAKGIKTITFSQAGDFVDEVLEPASPCEFRQ